MKIAIILLTLIVTAYSAALPRSLDKNLQGANIEMDESQEPVSPPEGVDPEDGGEPAIDCQGFFLNIFGC